MYFRVEIDWGGFIDSRFGIRTRQKMMESLIESNERWLAEVRGFYERAQFYLRGELLNNWHILSYMWWVSLSPSNMIGQDWISIV